MDAVLPGLLGGTAGAGITSTVDTPAPVDRESCSLFGSTALTVQGLMALLVLTSLVIKRYREHPQRPWRVWMGDVSKQIIGQGFLHSTNILFSTLMSHHGSKNACTAYFLSILIDCTLGVLIIYAVLRIFSYILIDSLHLPGFKNGQYYEHQKARYPSGDGSEDDIEQEEPRGARGDESGSGHGENGQDSSEGEKAGKDRFHLSWWGRQLLVYLLVLVVMKLAILGLFWIPAIFTVGDWLLSWLGEDTKIVFVLMVFPLAMNAFQFLLIDTILKSKPAHGSPALARSTSSSTGGRSSRRPGDDAGDDDDEEEQRAFLATSPTVETSDRMGGIGSGSGSRGSRPPATSAADQSILQSGQGEEDARSLRGGSLLPSYHESSSPPAIDTRKETQGHGQASPSYPPPSLYGSSGSSHTLVEKAGTSGPARRSIDIKLGEKLTLRPAETLAPVPSGQGMQRQPSQGSEAEGDGWDWLDDADAGDDERTEVGASSATSKSIWVGSTPGTGMERTPSQRMAAAV